MSAKLTVKDWILISAFVDETLTPAEAVKLRSRMSVDQELNKAVNEIAYTRRMLRALPPRRAPRNFTISGEKLKARTGLPVSNLWLKPALSFVSIASAVIFIFVFASPLVFRSKQSSAPMMQAAPEMALDSVEKASPNTAGGPMIINWITAYGMGGGEGDPYTGGGGVGGAGGPGWIVSQPVETLPQATEEPAPVVGLVPTEITPDPNNGGFGGGPPSTEPTGEPVPTEGTPPSLTAPQPTQAPSIARQAEETNGSDLSTLILGLPDPVTRGQVITTTETVLPRESTPLNGRTLLLILSAVLAALTGAAALIFRRR